MIGVAPFHQRLAELRQKQRKGPGLTFDEQLEMENCLDLNVAFCWEAAKLCNLSFLAHETDDVDWQHDICGRIDERNAKLQ